jgi:hypothetical protein
MMSNIDHLSRFEKFARELIEGSFDRFFAGRPIANQIAKELARVMETTRSAKDNKVASQYTVHLSPEALNKTNDEQPDLADSLVEYLDSLVLELGLVHDDPFLIQIVENPNLKGEQVLAQATELEPPQDPTKVGLAGNNDQVYQAIKAVDAFLIINGKRHVKLEKPVISIGRQLDNDIVLEEPTVSRKHLQLRWRYGRFVAYDLSSRVGTIINGDQISICVLQAGDVIMVGDAAIIYGEEHLGDTSKPIRPSMRDGSTRELVRNE